MPTRMCSLFVGTVYLLFGIAGLFPSHMHEPPHQLVYYQMSIVGHWGFLFSWLPVNTVHDIVYILLGAVGIFGAATFGLAQLACRALFAVSLLFVFLGVMPFAAAYVWGLMPLFGWNIMLHTVTATLTYYYGFVYPLDCGGPESVPTV